MYSPSSDLSRMRTMRTLDRGRAHGRPKAFHPDDDSPPTSAAQQRQRYSDSDSVSDSDSEDKGCTMTDATLC